ncbi:uroporphyrinogen decarboxylase [bacterium]|nr:uroporphyrinogen decarboxylase [bacterium]
MTSRERILKTLDHSEPDKIPYDLSGTTVTAITKTAFINAMKLRDLQCDFIMHDDIQQIVIPSKQVLDYLEVDTVRLGPARVYNIEKKAIRKDKTITYLDEWGITWSMNTESDFYFNEDTAYPLQNAKTIEDLKSYDFPNPDKTVDFDILRKELGFIPDDKALVVDRNCAGLFEMAFRIRGYENFYMDLACSQKMAEYLIDKILEIKMQYWDRVLSFAGKRTDVIAECDDLGTQQGLLVSPDMYRRILKPRQKKLLSFIKSKASQAKIFFHSCGAISEIIPDLIEAGVDILNPVQTNASGMNAEKLKKEFSKDICFWGGEVNIQETLPHGTPQQVRDDVKRSVEILAKDGGYVFSTVHNIQADVPAENFWAMWEEFQKTR